MIFLTDIACKHISATWLGAPFLHWLCAPTGPCPYLEWKGRVLWAYCFEAQTLLLHKPRLVQALLKTDMEERMPGHALIAPHAANSGLLFDDAKEVGDWCVLSSSHWTIQV